MLSYYLSVPEMRNAKRVSKEVHHDFFRLIIIYIMAKRFAWELTLAKNFPRRRMTWKVVLLPLLLLISNMGNSQQPNWLKVSDNGHFFETSSGKPFFWLGDTGWLLFTKCSREEAKFYLDTRKEQGFNVIQVMVLHTLGAENVYGNKALHEGNISKPVTTPGADFADKSAYDYWDHVDYIIGEAGKRGIYMALVPVWGSAVKGSDITTDQIKKYATFLTERYKDHANVIWLNGGDIRGDDRQDIWLSLGKTLKEKNPRHLITYHPRGRYSSTDWFHQEPWLDFNMFQSGHRTYAQDTSSKEKHRFGEDNWRYVEHDWSVKPAKPVLDGEPSYENIPKGLHDSLQPRWKDSDVRRYAYWSVFAGAAGFTYGENSIMQFNRKGDADANFGVTQNWKETIYAPGALQMEYLKQLMLGIGDYFGRQPAQEIVVDNDKTRYDYILATKGDGYAMAYTYTSKPFKIDFSKLGFEPQKAKWYNPANGNFTDIKFSKNANKTVKFKPPGKHQAGSDWVLVLEK